MRTDHEPWADPDVIKRVLTDCQTWAIVGLRDHPERSAYGVARMLQRNGKRIVPVHPDAVPVHGEQGYASLEDIPFPVDCVDVFRRLDQAGQYADQAVRIGAKAVWFQLDLIDEAAYARATDAGLDVVMNRCPAIEFAKLRAA